MVGCSMLISLLAEKLILALLLQRGFNNIHAWSVVLDGSETQNSPTFQRQDYQLQ